LVPHVRDAFRANPDLAQHNFFRTFISECGLWIREASSDDKKCNVPPTQSEQSLALPEGVMIRSLMQSDAELVNSNWEYRSDGSLEMIQKMIGISEAKGGCVGLCVDGTLVSWILRYLDGSLGMLFTDENYRRNGYAEFVVNGAVSDIRSKSQIHRENDTIDVDGERMISYIVDSNEASKNLYLKLGWKRIAGADWVGYAPRQSKRNSLI
jgi:hypothetical protein